MRKLTTCIFSLVSTFLIGTGVHHSLLKPKRVKMAVEIRAAVPLVLERTAQTAIPKSWKKVEIGKKFSVYLPPKMKGGSDGWDGQALGGSYEGEGYFFYYKYGRHAYSGWCNETSDFSDSRLPFSEVVVGGKRAWMNDSEAKGVRFATGMNDWPTIRLCFPDIGHGKTRLLMEVFAPYSPPLKDLQPILTSVEFK